MLKEQEPGSLDYTKDLKTSSLNEYLAYRQAGWRLDIRVVRKILE